MRPIVIAMALAASPIAPANAVVTYTLSISATGSDFNATAVLELPRYLLQPEPPVNRHRFFEASRLTSCVISDGDICYGLVFDVLTFVSTGEYGVVGGIGSLGRGLYGISLPTGRLDANGIYAGGDSAGRFTGSLVVSGEKTYVPEPAAWALLLTGFGLIGTAARRRRSAAAI